MAVISINIITPEDDSYDKAVALCREVFDKSKGLEFTPEDPEGSKNCILIAMFEGKEVIATALLMYKGEECEIKYIAVKNNNQNEGNGSRILTYCEDWAWIKGFQAIYCYSNDSALNFFDKNSYTLEGEICEINDASFIKMHKNLKGRYEDQYFTKATLLELYNCILEACPSFKERFLSSENKELPYTIASDFADHIVQLYRLNQGKKATFTIKKDLRDVSALIHRLINHRDDKVGEWAVIGILEDIQRYFRENAEADKFAQILTSQSKAWWDSLNKFWNQEIPYVGFDIKE